MQNTWPRVSWLDISCCSSWEPQPGSGWIRDTFRRQWKHCPQVCKIPAFIGRTTGFCFANPKIAGVDSVKLHYLIRPYSNPCVCGFDSILFNLKSFCTTMKYVIRPKVWKQAPQPRYAMGTLSFPATAEVTLSSAKWDLLKQSIVLLWCEEINLNWALICAIHICLLQILLGFMHSELILGKRPLGNCPVLCTPCLALSGWLRNYLFHAVPLSKENIFLCLVAERQWNEGTVLQIIHPKGWPELVCLLTCRKLHASRWDK